MDCSPPGSSVHGILQARVLEWAAVESSMGSFKPRDRTHVSFESCTGMWILYHQHHLGSPKSSWMYFFLFLGEVFMSEIAGS